jgi:hypothetical protein
MPLSKQTLLAISAAFNNGFKVIVLTETEVFMFPSAKLARQHASFNVAHVTLKIREFVGGLYSVKA